MTQKKPLHFAFIGMGATGTIGFLAFVNEMGTRFDKVAAHGAPVQFTLIDKDGDFGAGSPYSDPCPIFSLNQRIDEMSDCSERPRNFLEWMLREKDKLGEECELLCQQYDEHLAAGLTPERIAVLYPDCYLADHYRDLHEKTVAPRVCFGQFMRDQFNEAIDMLVKMDAILREQNQTNEPMVQVALSEGEVTGAAYDGDGHKLTLARGTVIKTVGEEDHELGSMYNATFGQICATHVYLAVGHELNNNLSNFRGDEGYADTPLGMQEMETALEAVNDEEPVLIVGTGQAMLDGMSSAEGQGYKGKYLLMSGSLVLPWPQIWPEKSDQPYQFSCCGLEHVADCMGSEDPIAAIAKFLQQEMHTEGCREYGGRHVLETIRSMRAEYEQTIGDPRICEEFFKLVDQHDGNSTSQRKFDMFMRVLNEGRIEFIQGRVLRGYTDPASANKMIVYKSGGEEKTVEIPVVVNCASMERRAVDEHGNAFNPVVGCYLKAGVLALDDRNQLYSTIGSLGIGGPARGEHVWGVNAMRSGAEKGAQAMFDDAFCTRGPSRDLKPTPAPKG